MLMTPVEINVEKEMRHYIGFYTGPI